MYQRAYAWEKKHCEDFLRDLTEHPHDDPSKRHFLGTVLLAAKPGGDFRNRFDIVDGQQRLTTATIFAVVAIAVIAKQESLRQRADTFRLALVEGNDGERLFHTVLEDEGFLERFIFGDQAPTDGDFSTLSKHRLWDAKQLFKAKLDSKSSEEADRLLTVLFRSRLLIYSVETPAEATQIFEFQNDRGKPLTELERLKSFLMHRLYLHSGPNADADLDIVQHAFGRIYLAAERFEAEPLSPGSDAVLSYHCAAFLRWSEYGVDKELWRQPKELVRESVKSMPARDVPSWIKNTAYALAGSFEAVYDILRERDNLDRLGGLFAVGRVAIFWPLLLKTWSVRHSNVRGFASAVGEMERLAWRMDVANLRSDTFESALRREAVSFSDDFDSLIGVLCELETWHRIRERLAANIDQDNFYSEGRTCRYLLWRYENHLLSQRGKQEKGLSWREAAGVESSAAIQLTLDHIQPQNSVASVLEKLVVWNPSDPAEEPRPFKQCFLNRLGNIVLDTRSTGAAKSDKNFNDRVSHYRDSRLLQEHELVEVYAETEDHHTYLWTEESIRRRHQVLKDFVKVHL